MQLLHLVWRLGALDARMAAVRALVSFLGLAPRQARTVENLVDAALRPGGREALRRADPQIHIHGLRLFQPTRRLSRLRRLAARRAVTFSGPQTNQWICREYFL